MTPSVSRQSATRQTAHPKKQATASKVGNGYSPSVPISVYRELAAEFQATKVSLDSVTAQNQQLTHQNQQLRQEIERIVQLSLHLQQVANAYQPLPLDTSKTVHAGLPAPEFAPQTVGQPTLSRGASSGAAPSRAAASHRKEERGAASNAIAGANNDQFEPSHPETLHTEQPVPSSVTREKDDRRTADFSGWWLAVAIILIISSAFGAGFLVVRSLLPSR